MTTDTACSRLSRKEELILRLKQAATVEPRGRAQAREVFEQHYQLIAEECLRWAADISAKNVALQESLREAIDWGVWTTGGVDRVLMDHERQPFLENFHKQRKALEESLSSDGADKYLRVVRAARDWVDSVDRRTGEATLMRHRVMNAVRELNEREQP